MIRRPHLFFRAITVPLDAIAIFSAAIAAYHLRLADFFVRLRPVTFDLTLHTYANIAAVAVLLWIGVFVVAGVFRTVYRPLGRELAQIFFASAVAMAAVFAVLFFSLEAFESRFIILAGWGLAVAFVWIERVLIRLIEMSVRRFGIGVKQAAIIGDNESAHTLRSRFENAQRLGVEVVATYKKFSASTREDLVKQSRKGKLDLIILVDPDISRESLAELKLFTDANHLDLQYSADLFSVGSIRMSATAVAGVPLIAVKKTPLDGWGAIYKRVFDVVFSLVLIVLTSPIMLLTTLFILFESGRPILFRNERVGDHGGLFDTLKFRSMKAEYSIGKQKGLGNQKKALEIEQKLIDAKSKKKGPVYKITEDPRITRFGRFIRKYSIDELPQFFNVLRGDMSLVGPRPHQPREVEKYSDVHRKVLNVRPGLTGMAQISGRSDLEFDDEVRLDTFYIENWTVWLDLVILIKTPFVVIFRKGAY